MKRLCFLFASILILATCKKKDAIEYSTYASQDHALAETLFNEIVEIVDDVASETDGIRAYDNCIDLVTVDTLSTPRSILIDYGSDDCEGADGRVRRGSILAEFSGKYRADGTIVTISPIGFTVDGFEVHGTTTITNLGANSNSNLEFQIEVENGQVYSPGNTFSFDWESTTVREWVEGDGSWFLIDDVYLITGNASGVNRNGAAFEAEITKPLRVEWVCAWFTEGIVEITPEGRDVRTLDYGLGECNSVVTVAVNDQNYTITF